MEEILYLSELFDYYGCLLTDKQKDYFEEYYFNNLTLEEIASNNNISKNAISKQLKGVKEKLYFYEHELKLLEKKHKLNKIIINLDEKTKKEINEVI